MNYKISVVMLAIFMLVLSIFSLPYAYYQILRWFICLLAVYYAYVLYVRNNKPLFYIMIIVAILFNPIAKLYFDKIIWALLDIVTAAIFGYLLYWIRKYPDKSSIFRDAYQNISDIMSSRN